MAKIFGETNIRRRVAAAGYRRKLRARSPAIWGTGDLQHVEELLFVCPQEYGKFDTSIRRIEGITWAPIEVEDSID